MNKFNNFVFLLVVISTFIWIIYIFNKLFVYFIIYMYDIKVNCFGRGVFWLMYGKIVVKLY